MGVKKLDVLAFKRLVLLDLDELSTFDSNQGIFVSGSDIFVSEISPSFVI